MTHPRPGLFPLLAMMAIPVLSTAKFAQAQINPSQIVVLEVIGGSGSGCEGPARLDFVQLGPDGKPKPGTSPSGTFRVPAKKVLIVTGVDWQYVHPDGAAGAGNIMTLRLMVKNIADTFAPGNRAFESTVTLSAKGEGGISESLTTGFPVNSKAQICPDVIPGPMGPPSGLQHLVLRGYLAADI
ncbi:MAG: hypothetical protein JF616_15065 [Fibrobacteres bacterium]|jgi:hypothetical protein|nr:hypothetical protein [Fibrobacterota bacterium]